jgi:hypothetical protein
MGENNYYKATDKTPLKIYAKDFDGNGNLDIVLSCYLKSEKGDLREYPVHFWDDLNAQSPKFRRKFNSYRKYGEADLSMLLTEDERTDAMILEANYTSTAYIENMGDGRFTVRALPIEAQFAPVTGIDHFDLDGDGNEDIVMIGNDFGNEIFTGRHDAFNGLLLLGNGKGDFKSVENREAGFSVKGNGKSLVKLFNRRSGVNFLAAQNRDSLKVFDMTKKSDGVIFIPGSTDTHAELHFQDGSKSKVEFYYGSGYLSQSSRRIQIPGTVTEFIVFDSKGISRKINPKSIAAR